MTWFKVDDRFHSHPKVLAVSLAARGLWTTAGSYSADQLTDGFVPDAFVAMHGAVDQAAELARAKLWRKVKGGFRFHDWAGYQPSRADVEQDRRAAADRQKRARDKARESRRDSPRESRDRHGTVTVPPTRPLEENLPTLRLDSRRAPSPRSPIHDGSHPNCRRCGTNPRAEGRHPRAQGTNPLGPPAPSPADAWLARKLAETPTAQPEAGVGVPSAVPGVHAGGLPPPDGGTGMQANVTAIPGPRATTYRHQTGAA